MGRFFGALALLLVFNTAAWADGEIANGKLHYRGFTVDVSRAQDVSDFDAVIASVKHQLDIAADCGARQDVLDFFREPPITLLPHPAMPPGEWQAGIGVEIEAVVLPPEKPIVLHELLHAYHFRVLPNGFQNENKCQRGRPPECFCL